jgi:surface protein
MKKRITLCIAVLVTFMLSMASPSHALTYYYFSSLPGSLNNEGVSYPFCDDIDTPCSYSESADVAIVFDDSIVSMSAADEDEDFNVVFSGGDVVGAEILYASSDESVVDVDDISFADTASVGDNTLTIGAFSGAGTSRITLIAKVDGTVVAGDYFDVTVSSPSNPNDFVTTWITTTADEEVTMPTSSSYNYSGTINWGDGTGELAFTSHDDVSFTHTYASADTYTVAISGTFEALDDTNDSSFPSQMKTVENLGSVGWETFYNVFKGSSITSFTAGDSDTSKVVILASMFYDASLLTSVDLTGLDASSVVYMNEMFRGTSSLTSIVGLDIFNTVSLESLSGIFRSASALTSLDLSGFDTSSVGNMFGVAFRASSLTSVDISGWDLSSVTTVHDMFREAPLLTTLTYNEFVDPAIYSTFLQEMSATDDAPPVNVDFLNGNNVCQVSDNSCISAKNNLRDNKNWDFEREDN